MALGAAGCKRPLFDRTTPSSEDAADLAPEVARWPVVRVSDAARFEMGATVVAAARREDDEGRCVWRFETEPASSDWVELEEPCATFGEAPWVEGSPLWASVTREGRVLRAEVLGLAADASSGQERVLLYFAATDPRFPLEIRTNLNVEFGAGVEQRVATEVFARSDGCTFIWNHGALGFATAEETVWVPAGTEKVLGDGQGRRFRARTFASVRPLGSPPPGCHSAGGVRFRLIATAATAEQR